MVQRNRAADCLREPLAASLPTRCQQLKKGYGDCKRGLVDMRKRFRGNMPVAYRADADAAAPDAAAGAAPAPAAGYQLYAGRSAFAGAVKETSGNEPIPPDWRDVENERYRLEQQRLQGAQK